MDSESLVQSKKGKKKKRKLDDGNKAEQELCLNSGDQPPTTSSLSTIFADDKSSATSKKGTKKKKKQIYASDKSGEINIETEEQCEAATQHCDNDVRSVEKDAADGRNELSNTKNKKIKMKKQKKQQQSATDVHTTDENSEDGKAEMAAIAYLKKWKEDHGAWNFQKVRQTWLLKNVYNCEKLCNEDFLVLMEYLEGLKGHSRSLTVKQAQTLMDKADSEVAGSAKVLEEQVSRARQILQFLSD